MHHHWFYFQRFKLFGENRGLVKLWRTGGGNKLTPYHYSPQVHSKSLTFPSPRLCLRNSNVSARLQYCSLPEPRPRAHFSPSSPLKWCRTRNLSASHGQALYFTTSYAAASALAKHPRFSFRLSLQSSRAATNLNRCRFAKLPHLPKAWASVERSSL